MKAKINLENAENIVRALKRRAEHDELSRPLCPCKPQSNSDDDVCPCLNMRTNNECCCGLFIFEDY